MPHYLLALDQGTSSSHAALFACAPTEHNIELAALESVAFDCLYPHSGWVEQDANTLWQSQLSALKAVLNKADISATQIHALGITNQRETVIAWRADTGAPLHNAIVWQCRRTADFCAQMQADGFESELKARTGLVADAYFSASKMRWLLQNVPAVKQAAASGNLKFGTVDSWLIWQLTKGRVHVTDASNAARTQLYNIHRQDWDPVLFDYFGIARECLPEVISSSGFIAHTDAGLLGVEIPISGCAGDQQAALFGQSCFAPGMVKHTYGTGGFMLMNTGPRIVESAHGLLSTVAWKIGDEITYALEGSVFVAGALIQFLRDNLQLFEKAGDCEQLAQSVENNGGVYIVPAFTGLGAPYWDAEARGLICGLHRGSSKAHIARAALEAVAYQTHDLLRAMAADTGLEIAELKIDGGMAVNNFLAQFQADILQCALTRARITESTALGAALLAGLGSGLLKSLEDIARLWQAERIFTPAMTAADRQKLLSGWQHAVRKARA